MKKYATKVFTPVIILLLGIFTAIIFFSFRQSAEAKATAVLVTHSYDVMFQTSAIQLAITDDETGSRGYALTGQREFLEPLRRSQKNIYGQINNLKKLTHDNKSQQVRIDSLLYFTRKRLAFSDSTVQVRNRQGLVAVTNLIATGNGKSYMDKIRDVITDIQQEENRLLADRKRANEQADSILKRITIAIIVVIVFLLIIFARKDYLQTAARKSAEQILKTNEALLQLMTNNIKETAIFMLDVNGKVTTWNRGAEMVLGYEKEEVYGKPVSLFYSKADLETDEPRRNLALAKKYGQYEIEGMRLKKDGSTLWANAVITALVNDTGDFYGYSSIIRDITEKKKTEEQVSFLSTQINHSNDAIFIVDPNLNIKSWNRGAERLYGYTAKEVLDKDSNVILQTNLSKEQIQSLLQQIAREDYWTGELKRKTKAGKEIIVHSSTSTIRNNDGVITGYVAVSFDISAEIKLREQVNYLASLVEQSKEAIISTDNQECIISWNQAAEQLYGYTRAETLGKTLSSLGLAALTGNDFPRVLKQVLDQGSWKSELSLPRKDGSIFFGAVTASVIMNAAGEQQSLAFLVNDISLRKQLEEQLRQSNEELENRVQERTEEISKNEQRFRALIENSAEGIALLDANGSIFYRSPAAYRITGDLPLGNAMGSIHPEDLATIQQKGEEAIQHAAVPIEWQGRFKHANGKYAWMEGTFTNLLHIDGVNAIVANYRNISTRKLAEEQLVASEQQFRHTLDNMLEGVQIIGFDWRYIYVNDSMAKHGKYAKNEMIGHTVMEKYPGIEDTPIYEVYKQCLEGRKTFHLENEFVFPDKSVAWFELSFQPVPEGIFILSVDITDRKKAESELRKSEEHYRNLFENMLHGFAFCKGHFDGHRLIDYEFLNVNNEFEEQTGLTNVSGKRISEVAPEVLQANQEYIDTIAGVALKGKVAKFETYTAPLKRWLSVILYSPEREYFVVLVDNISERKQAEYKIKKLNEDLEARVIKRTEQLKKTNNELEAFSYSVSHDLRAPLRAIIGFTAVLEDEYSDQLDEEAKRITGIIKSNTLRMGRLIDDLLAFSRMGRADIIKTHIDTDMMIREIIDLPEIQQYNRSNPITWVVHDLPNINADANTLRQVWINLIGNAVKYSNKVASPKIEIDFYQEKGKIIFFVKDNGVGFDEKYKNKLFRVFQRLHSADEFEGTGIGLAIVEKIISKHNGSVWAEAAPGKGAIFYFSLPETAAIKELQSNLNDA